MRHGGSLFPKKKNILRFQSSSVQFITIARGGGKGTRGKVSVDPKVDCFRKNDPGAVAESI